MEQRPLPEALPEPDGVEPRLEVVPNEPEEEDEPEAEAEEVSPDEIVKRVLAGVDVP